MQLGGANVVLTSADLVAIGKVLADVEVQGARYPAHIADRVGGKILRTGYGGVTASFYYGELAPR